MEEISFVGSIKFDLNFVHRLKRHITLTLEIHDYNNHCFLIAWIKVLFYLSFFRVHYLCLSREINEA